MYRVAGSKDPKALGISYPELAVLGVTANPTVAFPDAETFVIAGRVHCERASGLETEDARREDEGARECARDEYAKTLEALHLLEMRVRNSLAAVSRAIPEDARPDLEAEARARAVDADESSSPANVITLRRGRGPQS